MMNPETIAATKTNDTRPPPRRFLTHDEIVVLHSKRAGCDIEVRVRVWRGKDATPVVLASPHANAKGLVSVPMLFSSRIANYAAAALAGYPDCSILYFSTDSPVGAARSELYQLHFEYFGNPTRLRFFNPVARKSGWEHLEMVVGESIEH